MQTETVRLRPVTAADTAALAELVAQLYHAEEPRVLRGPLAGRLRLFGHLVAHELATGGHGRFLAVDDAGTPLGSASVRLHNDPAPGVLPPGLFATAIRSVGLTDTLRFYGYLVRGSLSSETPLRRDECYIYSVVVHEGARRRGVGAAMMEQIEAYARRAGMSAALLRVMSSNDSARRLYRRLGYRTVARTSPLLSWLGVPSELMGKELS